MLNQILGPVMFFSGSLEEYNSLSEKAPNGVYFINNTENGNRLLYLGDSLFPIHWVLIEKEDELPNPGVPDVLYISNNTNCFYYWEEDTKEYVIKYGENIVNRAEFIDAFQRVSYDESTRVITVPVYKDSEIKTLTINLGKDLIIEGSGNDKSHYDAATRRIRLKLATSDPNDPGENDGYIDIPVDDLIDIYEGTPESDPNKAVEISVKEATNSSSVDVRTITATVNSAEPNENDKKNYLEVREDGLYVDVESYTEEYTEKYVKEYTNIRLGDLGSSNDGKVFSTVGEGLTYILDQTNTKAPLARQITSTGKTLEKDLSLTVDDIVGAAPIQNAVFTGRTQRDPIDIHATITEAETENGSIKATEIATVKYVNDVMSVANTWGGFIQYLTWGHFVNE